MTTNLITTKSHSVMRQYQVGFTLLELLVVIVIIITAAAVVAPSLGSRAQQARLDSGAARLDALVRHARTRAVIERRDVAL
ncbi:MAG: prepilin-type N-terminal cleavage/methylation domain-containing protein [Acidiferrobacteraceae bacterium]|nr:prepilin-type N-terminal cleavage/methylation domain-containing protein [Acidiferrobacteraceae bacterium]